jgi:hypothetical protein
VEKPSEIPAEFLHGRRDDQGKSFRVNASPALSSLGQFSIRPQQAEVRAVFVSLRRLQKELQLEGKVNTILVSEREHGQAWQQTNSQLETVIRQSCRLEDLGIKVRALEKQQCLVLESESTLINQNLEQAARATADELGLRTSSILTYLANLIRSGRREVPYSLVTAMDRQSLSYLETEQMASPIQGRNVALGRKGEDVASSLPPILLNDWAARDLDVQRGADISLDYYVWLPEGQLVTRSAQFRLDCILPLKGITADRNLAPEYPGITESGNLSDWDPPFPMDLGRIRPRDEAYWRQYKTTPKAYIPIEVGQKLWQSRFGKLSSLRFFPAQGITPESIVNSYQQKLRSVLNPLQVGLSVYAARGQGLEASRGATDFGEYFLYFSFFLVASALLLTALFFKLGVEQRLREIGLLQALGFPGTRIRTLFFSEGLVLAILGSISGIVGAVAYGRFIMWGLRHWWTGAVGTTRLDLHLSPGSIGLGAAGGVLTGVVCIVWTLRSLAQRSPRSLLSGEWNAERSGSRDAGNGEGSGEIGKEVEGDSQSRFSASPRPPFSVFPRPDLRPILDRCSSPGSSRSTASVECGLLAGQPGHRIFRGWDTILSGFTVSAELVAQARPAETLAGKRLVGSRSAGFPQRSRSPRSKPPLHRLDRLRRFHYCRSGRLPARQLTGPNESEFRQWRVYSAG